MEWGKEEDGLSVMINNGGCAPLSRRRRLLSYIFHIFFLFFFLFRAWFDGQISGLSSSWPLACRRTDCGLCFACSSTAQKNNKWVEHTNSFKRRMWLKGRRRTWTLPNASYPFVFFCLFSGRHSVDGVFAFHYFPLRVRLAS